MPQEIIKGSSIPLKGEFAPPGDKSISHRAVIIGSLTKGGTKVNGFLSCDDTLSSANAMTMLGVPIVISGSNVEIRGKGLHGLSEPENTIDAGNSGTTARLLTGLLSAQGFFATITGDKYLRVRPMERVIKPLTLMGAKIWGRDGGKRLPLAIQGTKLSAISYESPVASAQVKSALLLAGLYAEGETEVIEPAPTRDHTERMLSYLGADVKKNGKSVKITTGPTLKGLEISIPGDISSAAYFIVAALINPRSEILIKNVGINPDRIGGIEILRTMGGFIEIINKREASGEPVADILVRSSALKASEIKGKIIPKAIDELPVIAVAACFSEGETIIKDAMELRVKETDRIKAMTRELKKLGADLEELDDGMIIRGKDNLKGGICSSWGDHRVAMALAVAATRARGDTEIQESDCVSVSFPGFFDVMRRLRG
ncbi:MAG: 3-phosphoshikimate 1-carboxyvinyltransferase [Nitrospirae bacterium]|nr:3-phosphoshikimate 1-carboxyvinyltransferase [Candidatus Dadabacteria bacterium]MCI0468933.1 3-phosphoshikimate 1-carboxyvinyltransferase [Nitrospirota bacterium]